MEHNNFQVQQNEQSIGGQQALIGSEKNHLKFLSWFLFMENRLLDLSLALDTMLLVSVF